MEKVFLLRSVCGDHGTFDANTIQSLPKDYAEQLKTKKLARKATKEDEERVRIAILSSPMRVQALKATSGNRAPKRKKTTTRSGARKTTAKKATTKKSTQTKRTKNPSPSQNTGNAGTKPNKA